MKVLFDTNLWISFMNYQDPQALSPRVFFP